MKLKPSRLLSVLLILGGVLCIVFPIVASASIDIIIGVSLIFAAFFTLFQLPYAVGGWAKLVNLILVVLYLVSGAFLLKYVALGAITIATFAGAFMLVEGILSLIAWSGLRKAKGGLLLLLNGIATIIVGGILLFNPQADIALLGLLFGINLLATGIGSLGWTAAE